MTPQASWRERWNPPWTIARAKRVASITVMVLAGSWLLYVIVANLLIKTSVLASMVSEPGRAEVEWASGSTWWPGRFHLERFRLRTHDSGIEMQLEIDEAHFTLVVSEALSKHLYFTRVEAEGVSIAIRQRLDPDLATPARVALLPDIEGFPKPPIKDPVRKPQTDSEKVILEFENIDLTHVRDVWIDEMHYTGDTHVKGAFYFQPTKRLAITGARLDVLGGQMHMGKDPVAVGLSGTVDCTVQPFDVKYPEGAEILGNFDFGVHLDGRLENLRWVNFFVNQEGFGGPTAKKAPVATFSGGAGALHTHVSVFHGVLKGGSTAEIEAKGIVAEVGGHTVTSDLLAKIAVKDPVAAAPKGTVTTALNGGFAIRAKGREGAIVDAKKTALLATSHELDLAKGFPDVVLSADLDDTRVDLAALDPYVASKDFHVVSGEAAVKAHVDLDPKADLWKGESTVRSEKVGVRYKGKLVTANIDTRAVVPKAQAGVVDLSGGSVDVKDLRIDQGARTWWGRVDLVKAEAHEGPVVFVADLKTRGRDARPLLTFFPVDLPAWMTGLLDLDGLAGTMKLKVGDDLLAVENIAGKGGDFTVEGTYLKKATQAGGAFLVSWHMLTVGFDIQNEHVGVVPLGASSWYRERTKVR